MSLRGGRWAVMCRSCSKKSPWQETQRSSFSFQREREQSVHGVTCQSNTFLCTEKLSAIQWHTARIWGRLRTFSDTQGFTSKLQKFWEALEGKCASRSLLRQVTRLQAQGGECAADGKKLRNQKHVGCEKMTRRPRHQEQEGRRRCGKSQTWGVPLQRCSRPWGRFRAPLTQFARCRRTITAHIELTDNSGYLWLWGNFNPNEC